MLSTPAPPRADQLVFKIKFVCITFVFSYLLTYLYIFLIHALFPFQIVEYLYYIISTYLSSSYSFQYRIGALYSLYAIYHTQLAQPKVKVFVFSLFAL